MKKKSRKFMTPAEKKAETAREVEVELGKKKKELGEEEQNRRVRERMRLCQEATLKDAEETREKDRKKAQEKLERMELGGEEEFAVVEDNDFVIRGPSQEEGEAMKTAGWDGPAHRFKDVRIKDAQREFNASSAVRKVIMSSVILLVAVVCLDVTAEDK